jgi:hypothetical protein
MKKLLVFCSLCLSTFALFAQQTTFDLTKIPISKADLGTFPYFKTLPNFYPSNSSDSMTIEMNRTYFYDGAKCFIVDGKVSVQNINVKDREKPFASEFQIIQEFDKVVSTLGGVKVFTVQFPKKPSNPWLERMTK